MDASAHFATLARYHAWATRRLLDAVDALADAGYRRGCGLFFGSVHATLNHLLVADAALWWPRFAGRAPEPVALDAELEADRGRLRARLLDAAAGWAPLVAAWPAARFDGRLDYTTTRGDALSLPFAATLAHVFNHGTHHRGQISAALTAAGVPAPGLDLVEMLQGAPAAHAGAGAAGRPTTPAPAEETAR